MKPLQVIYSPRILVFRDSDKYSTVKDWKDCFFVDAIAMAAIRRPKLDTKGKMSAQDVELTRNKIRMVLRAAHYNGNTALVLGAAGCGAFQNNPEQIAEAFKSVLSEAEFKSLFDRITFAVLSDRKNQINFPTFCRVLLDA